jgi:hypothetical protein
LNVECALFSAAAAFVKKLRSPLVKKRIGVYVGFKQTRGAWGWQSQLYAP